MNKRQLICCVMNIVLASLGAHVTGRFEDESLQAVDCNRVHLSA